MPHIAREYKYVASTPHQLIESIANDENIKWCNPYGSLSKSRQEKLKPIFLKILDITTGGDHLSFINHVLSPMDVAQHIYPSNEVIFITISNTILCNTIV